MGQQRDLQNRVRSSMASTVGTAGAAPDDGRGLSRGKERHRGELSGRGAT